MRAELSKNKEHREGLEPTSPHYGCGILAAGRPVHVSSVGPEGLEPSPAGLRARCAAANTLIPYCFIPQHRRGGSRTLDLILIRDLLSPLSYAPANRAGGTRTLTCRIKSPVCCRYTTTPMLVGRMRFNRVNIASLLFLRSRQVVALRVELSATRLSAAFGQPALDYRRPSRDGRTRTCVLVLPRHAGLPLPYIPHVSQNGRI